MKQPLIDVDALMTDSAPGTMGPNDVPFTQYLRPNGRKRLIWVERSPEIAAEARRVRNAGYHFDIEELRDGTVSMTVEPNSPNADGDDAPIAMELCPNGPAVPSTVDRLVAAAVRYIERGRP